MSALDPEDTLIAFLEKSPGSRTLADLFAAQEAIASMNIDKEDGTYPV